MLKRSPSAALSEQTSLSSSTLKEEKKSYVTGHHYSCADGFINVDIPPPKGIFGKLRRKLLGPLDLDII